MLAVVLIQEFDAHGEHWQFHFHFRPLLHHVHPAEQSRSLAFWLGADAEGIDA